MPEIVNLTRSQGPLLLSPRGRIGEGNPENEVEKELRRKLVPIPLIVSGVGNSSDVIRTSFTIKEEALTIRHLGSAVLDELNVLNFSQNQCESRSS